jgi:hypothetical protein
MVEDIHYELQKCIAGKGGAWETKVRAVLLPSKFSSGIQQASEGFM